MDGSRLCGGEWVHGCVWVEGVGVIAGNTTLVPLGCEINVPDAAIIVVINCTLLSAAAMINSSSQSTYASTGGMAARPLPLSQGEVMTQTLIITQGTPFPPPHLYPPSFFFLFLILLIFLLLLILHQQQTILLLLLLTLIFLVE